MSKRILNTNNCIFKCSALAGSITILPFPPTFKDGNGQALTKNTKLCCNGICSILTSSAGGVPTPCTQVCIGSWIKGIELNKKINNVSLLNQNAMIMCPVGGQITATLKPLIPPVSVDTPAMPTADTGVRQNETTSDKDKNDSLKDEKNSHEENNRDKKEVTEEKVLSDTETDKEETEEKKSTEKEKKKYDFALCPYENCEKAENCPYIQAASTIDTKGAASKLRRNSSAKERDYDELADIHMQKYEISWGNQAHHMISINDAYCRYPELVKLGNYFGYDINCKENCYFLPAWEKGDGYGEKPTHYKKAQAYEVMVLSGLQWHVGQHNYRIELPQEIISKYPQLRTMKCYSDKINEDVKKLVIILKKRFENGCPKENYEKNRNYFIEKMNGLSTKIEEHLDIFGTYPKDSIPYYVSAEALRYAFEIPRSEKVIFVKKEGNDWIFRKYKYTKYLKNNNQVFMEETDRFVYRDKRACILFCESITCFLIADESRSFKLPFKYCVYTQYISDSDIDRKDTHFSALTASASDKGSSYVFPKRMISERLKEL
ncbi:MAG: AHH domain-containing protein [Ruminococcus sp.]|nr:AHH domain-containing protein [Ruminococcus sp.]